MLYWPFPYDRVLINPTPEELQAELTHARQHANGKARVRTVPEMRGEQAFQATQGHVETLGMRRGRMPSMGATPALGYAWFTDHRDYKHVRVIGGRIYPRVAVWGEHREVPRAPAMEIVYPDVALRRAALWVNDDVVRSLLPVVAADPEGKTGSHLILADRLEELGGAEESRLMREDRRWKMNHPRGRLA